MTRLPRITAALANLVGWICLAALVSGCYLPTTIEPNTLTPAQASASRTPALAQVEQQPASATPVISTLGFSSPSPTRGLSVSSTSGANTPAATSTATATPNATPTAGSSTGAAAPASPTANAAPSATPTPTSTPSLTLRNPASPSPTRRPTRTPTPTRTPRIGYARIGIQKPGPLSRLVSPIQAVVSLIPGIGGTVRIDLFGEDGRLLYREEMTYGSSGDNRNVMTRSIDFEIPAVAETGRLTVAVEDPDGLVIALTSVDVILLSMGENDPNPSGDLLEPFFIQRPWSQQRINDGTLTTVGLIRPVSEQPVYFEIISSTGETLGARQMQPDPDLLEEAAGGYIPFEIDIPFTISKATWARLVIRQVGARLTGNIALNSIQVYLAP